MPLRRTYASLNIASLNINAVQPSPAPPSPTLMRTALQPTIKNPKPPRHSSLLILGKIIPPFKPRQNLYRRVLKREFLRATKKAMNDTELDTESLTTNNSNSDVTTDDQWPVAVTV